MPTTTLSLSRIVRLAPVLAASFSFNVLPLNPSAPAVPRQESPSAPGTTTVAPPDDPPVFAHYYIWFQSTSWNRAKVDFPLAGRYTSDQESVMREHIELAKEIGLDGFIVSWKSTEVLDPRLETLIKVADEEDFHLALTYQGLDFDRKPLPVSTIELDLDHFIERYAGHPAFQYFDKPLVVLTGTWEMTPNDIARITNSRRDQLLILASEKNVEGYERIADLVDGDLYYWSSVNPDTYPGYPQKLIDMRNAIASHGGMWVAPVAPGFDAREVGGETRVDRADGKVLREQWNGALKSVPDMIGLISWNEFSENTHIEPSEMYGDSYAEVVAELTGARAPTAIDFDSSSPEGFDASPIWLRLAPIAALVVLIGYSTVRIARRGRGGGPTARPRFAGPGRAREPLDRGGPSGNGSLTAVLVATSRSTSERAPHQTDLRPQDRRTRRHDKLAWAGSRHGDGTDTSTSCP